MSARPQPARGATRGNFIAEWFGHRVWPTVDGSDAAIRNQSSRSCPFLTFATGEDRKCIKIPRSGAEPTGVCTVSSDSNGERQDWLACPYRILDQDFTLLIEAVRTLYRVEPSVEVLVLPVTVFHRQDVRERVNAAIRSPTARVFAFTSDKLGGEVDIPETDASPGAKVDVSIIELLATDAATGVPSEFGRHVFYEIQTSDFHGSPLHAIGLLQGLCPARTTEPYHDRLRENVEICGTGVEGPNKANVFKRTIYQTILKVRMAEHPACAGFMLVLPLSVWESWRRHFGLPKLDAHEGDARLVSLAGPGEEAAMLRVSARSWIFVFDIDRESTESPQPIRTVLRIATSAEALSHFAFLAAADAGVAAGVIDRFREVLSRRVLSNWKAH